MSGIMAPDEDLFAEQADGDIEELPPGATPEGVADDIDIKISEGEIVIPEDVSRWHGLKWFMQARHEAKEGLALMEQEGLIKKPAQAMTEADMGMPSDGLMSPMEDEDEFFDGGTADGSSPGNDGTATDGTDSGPSNGAEAADAASAAAAASVSTPAGTQANEEAAFSDPLGGVGSTPAATASHTTATENAASMNSGISGYFGGLAGGRASVEVDPQTGLYGTSYASQPAQGVASVMGMGLGVPGAGRAVGMGLDALGVAPTPLGFDPTNNGLAGAQASGVQGFGAPGEDLNEDGADEAFEMGLTAYQALMGNPFQ